MLAGLRGVDEDLRKAARIDGVPIWRYYTSIVLPLLRPMVVTAAVLLATSVAKLYDLVVAMTLGGPGIATEVPAKFVMDHLFERNNIALGTPVSIEGDGPDYQTYLKQSAEKAAANAAKLAAAKKKAEEAIAQAAAATSLPPGDPNGPPGPPNPAAGAAIITTLPAVIPPQPKALPASPPPPAQN